MTDIKTNKLEMLKEKRWVVVGATPHEEKFGYKVFKKLKKNNYEVYGINPKYKEIEGEPLFSDLDSLPVKPECISVVVAPAITEKLVEKAGELGIEYIWFQPGTYTSEIVKRAEELNMKPVFNDCVLVELGH